MDRTQHQVNAVEDSAVTSAESDDRLYDIFVARFALFVLFDADNLVCILF